MAIHIAAACFGKARNANLFNVIESIYANPIAIIKEGLREDQLVFLVKSQTRDSFSTSYHTFIDLHCILPGACSIRPGRDRLATLVGCAVFQQPQAAWATLQLPWQALAASGAASWIN